MKTVDISQARPPAGDVVVLIHGLAAHRLVLWPLERHLNRTGFQTINWGYQSLWGSIDRHASRLLVLLDQLQRNPGVEHIRLVTHSMGGIVARRVLTEASRAKIRNLVMLGPPNCGSRVATVLARSFGSFCRPLSELSDGEGSYVRRLPVPDDVEVGIIAATFDRVVSVESTHLPTERDHLVVPSGHTSMLLRSEVAEQTVAFLRHGRFERIPESTSTVACRSKWVRHSPTKALGSTIGMHTDV
jgi:hypothetical protein